jgi:hypothetical protein
VPWLPILPAEDNDETLTTIREELADMNNFHGANLGGCGRGTGALKIMATYMNICRAKCRAIGITGAITFSGYERFQLVRDQQRKEGVHIALPMGN